MACINANEAAKMTKEYWDAKERKAKEEANKLFPEVMDIVNSEIISAASCGQGKCEISLQRLTGICDHKVLARLRDKVEDELAETLGYRVTTWVSDHVCIVWNSDV